MLDLQLFSSSQKNVFIKSQTFIQNSVAYMTVTTYQTDIYKKHVKTTVFNIFEPVQATI